MRILRFKAEGLHGFLKFNLTFKNTLTFLTGINGSGKTSALNSIIALVTPDLSMLAGLEYESILVEVEHDEEKLTISARTFEDTIEVRCSGISETLTFSRFSPDPDAPAFRSSDSEDEYYRDIISIKSASPVIRKLLALPTPMFLGIDRRSSFGLGRMPGGNRQSRFGRNIFSKSLSGSLMAAASLAENRYRDALIQAGRLGERMQREMLLGLLGSDTDEPSDSNTLRLPAPEDIRELQRVRRDLHSIAAIMRLPVSEVQKRLIPLLDRLQRLAERIPDGTNLERAFTSDSDNSKIITAIAAWNANQSHLLRVRFISEKVAAYNSARTELLSSLTSYQRLVNGFLNDSGKSIVFGDEGYIGVEIDGLKDPRPISSLSSGEAQIFVILTHLAFNPSAQRNNVFIIDEPELSLHVQWQEMFVSSAIEANPNIQYILATHSPSIILDRVNDCIDIAKKTSKRAGKKERDDTI